MADQIKDPETGEETTGHEWDGITELNNPLPRWWLWIFYATIVWGVIYTILYPAWPLMERATPGLLAWSTRADVAAEIAAVEERNAPMRDALAGISLAGLPDEPELHRFAVSMGASVFRTNCSQCHGTGAAGFVGYPNLLDNAWLWGGSLEDIAYTVRHGIRNEEDLDARWSEMPAFGDMLIDDEIDALVAYVRAMSGQAHDEALLWGGEVLYADNCASCHGDAGAGDPWVGAPALNDAIWLYGGSEEAIEYTIRNARFGVMPPWGERLGEAQVRAVAAYVHQLGGGE